MKEVANETWVFEDAVDEATCQTIIDGFDAMDQRIPSHVYNSSNPVARRGEVVLLSQLKNGELLEEFISQRFSEAAIEASIAHPGLSAILKEPHIWTKPRVERVEPGGGFVWHMDSLQRGRDRRTLTAILYLNSVIGGELEFWRDQISITPKRGTIVLFPPFWTHVHRGNSPTGAAKYAIGSFVYLSREDEDGRFFPA